MTILLYTLLNLDFEIDFAIIWPDWHTHDIAIHYICKLGRYVCRANTQNMSRASESLKFKLSFYC